MSFEIKNENLVSGVLVFFEWAAQDLNLHTANYELAALTN